MTPAADAQTRRLQAEIRRLRVENDRLRSALNDLARPPVEPRQGRPQILDRIRTIVNRHDRLVIAYDQAYDFDRGGPPGRGPFSTGEPWVVEAGHGLAVRCGPTLEKALMRLADATREAAA